MMIVMKEDENDDYGSPVDPMCWVFRRWFDPLPLGPALDVPVRK